MKYLDEATYVTILDIQNHLFKGGELVTLDSSDKAVGLPRENPNLSEEAISAYNEVYSLVANDTIIIPSSLYKLTVFLNEYGYTTKSGLNY